MLKKTERVFWDPSRFASGSFVDIIISDQPDFIYSGYVCLDSFGRKCIELDNECYYPDGRDLILLSSWLNVEV